MASVGLCIITKELTTDLIKTIDATLEYVDLIYLQLNGETESKTITPWKHGRVHVSSFDWVEDFAAARNALLSHVKTDYWVWMDTDDEIAGLDNLRATVEHMEQTGVDIMMAPYIYNYDANGNPTEVQNRERIIRTSLKGEWYGAIHETYIPDTTAVSETTSKIQWVHRKTKDEHDESMARNRRILEREYARTPRDPRIAYYLGLNYGMSGDYDRAIECFKELIRTGGWDEERYRAYLQIFSCYFELKDYASAINYALQATTELPEYPDAYFMLQQAYYQMDDYQKSLEWYKVGKSKPIPKSDSAFNPITRVEQPLYLAATAHLFLGKPQPAMRLLLELQRINPTYPIPESVKQTTLEAVNEERVIEATKLTISYLMPIDPEAATRAFEALPPALRSDYRLTKERRAMYPSAKWGKGSIAYYCGQSYEPWGPDTLDQGMGGSEEAVLYLTRELAKDHNITVFNERQETTFDRLEGDSLKGAVTYVPWTEINPADEFDVFIAWRNPAACKDITARVKIVDLHDIIPPEDVYDATDYVDKFLFKSIYHRELYPDLPEDKVCIIGNGIKMEQFK